MMKTEQIIVRVNPEIKAEAMAIFRKIGISASEAVNLFLTHIITEKGIPSDMHIPNKETLRAFQDSDSGRNMKTCGTLDELYEDLIYADYLLFKSHAKAGCGCNIAERTAGISCT